jgi:sortase A
MLPPTTINSPDILNTLPLYYDDGSVGTLHFPKLNLTVKVYEGETLENMRVGVGRFEFTSAWDGNVGVAGHNRGVPAAIGGIKDFANGEKIIYTTKYGTRTYEVYNIQQIADTDYSLLGWSEDNILTIITCVENTPNMRWAVQFREVN